MVNPDRGVSVGEAPTSVGITLAASPTLVWGALRKTYAAFMIPVAVDNPAIHQIGNSNFYKSVSFAGQPMTALVNCGNGATGPNAAKYRIYMSVLTNVNPDPKGGTLVQLGFIATGRDVAGNSTETISCGSSGVFERAFLDRLKLIVGNGG
jgi:hypothetical protein